MAGNRHEDEIPILMLAAGGDDGVSVVWSKVGEQRLAERVVMLLYNILVLTHTPTHCERLTQAHIR